jgi:hypothetical protein
MYGGSAPAAARACIDTLRQTCGSNPGRCSGRQGHARWVGSGSIVRTPTASDGGKIKCPQIAESIKGIREHAPESTRDMWVFAWQGTRCIHALR